MNVGKRLRALRRSLGLTQQQFVKGKMDRSFYSRVETGRNTITVNALLKVLEAQNVSVVDFLKDGNTCEVNKQNLQDELLDAYLVRDAKKLKELGDKAKLVSLQLNLASEFLQIKLADKVDQLSEEDKRKMKRVVFQINYIDSETLWYLLVFMDLYDFEELESLVNSIFKKFKRLKFSEKRSLGLLAKIAARYFKICQRYNVQEAKKTAEFIKRLPTDGNTFLSKAVVLKRNEKDSLNFWLKEVGYEDYLI